MKLKTIGAAILLSLAPVLLSTQAGPITPYYQPKEYRVHKAGEIEEIIERLIWTESKSNAKAVNYTEYSVGLMQITKIARDEFNSWTGKSYNYWTMFEPESNRECGSYYLTNITLRYRCNWNIVQAVAAYNCGISNVGAGIYPSGYVRAIIPWHWELYRSRFRVKSCWTNDGAEMMRLVDWLGNPPRIGL